MCTEHTARCPACGRVYLVYVVFCQDYHPPFIVCPWGTTVLLDEMREGQCPSPTCPNSIRGGCEVM